VLDLARQIAQNNGWDLWIWSVIGGLRDGLIVTPSIPNTEHPAALMYQLAERIRSRAGERPAIYAILDIAGHLDDDRTLRALREAIDAARQSMAGVPIGQVPAAARR